MDAHERLIHYAAISAEDEVSRAPFNMNMISAATVHRRNRAVNWIDVVCVHLQCKFIIKFTTDCSPNVPSCSCFENRSLL